MYVDMKIRDKNMVAMVDSGATHIFVASKFVKQYELKVTDCPPKIKAANSGVEPGYNIANNVPLKIGHSFSVHTLIVVPLDDFNVLLGIDFMRKFKVALIPHLDGLMFTGEGPMLSEGNKSF